MGTPAPDALLRLIDRFDQDRKVFLSGDYKEEQLRLEFLNPLFTALGWDMDNRCEPDNSEFRTQRPECRTSGYSDFWFLTSDFWTIRLVNRKDLSEFSVTPADVLGQVYEQFLGKVMRLTAGHQAKGVVSTGAFHRPSAPRRLPAMLSEPRPALTETR